MKDRVYMSSEGEIAVEVRSLSKAYGSVFALNALDMKIKAGEYFVLLGPSGGGKTTLLRLVGGFIRPTLGNVFLHGKDVTNLPPNLRPTSMVFQSFALFPHMTVAKNVSYGLRLRKRPEDEILDRVQSMLKITGLQGLGDRMPHELSGGQQQRVQLARSLVLETKILLLDEPLAALDARLRKEMCIELKRLQEKVGITFVHVTHNQEEAMTVADNLAIISDGRLVESGSTIDLYESPGRRFTAEFIGENNIFDGEVKSINGEDVQVDLGYGIVSVFRRDKDVLVGDRVSISIRSELIKILDNSRALEPPIEELGAVYRQTVYLGLISSGILSLANGGEVVIRDISNNIGFKEVIAGTKLRVGWSRGDGRLHTN